MANKPQLKAVGEQDLGDSDPFAELTRIMGFDPRVQPTPRPEDDFHIDLEKELMGEFEGADERREDARQDEPHDKPLADLQGQASQPVNDGAARETDPQPLTDDLEDALTSAFEQEFGEDVGVPGAHHVVAEDLPPADENAATVDGSGDAAFSPGASGGSVLDDTGAVADRGPELAESLNRLLSGAGYKSGSSFSGTAQVYEIGMSYTAPPPSNETSAAAEPEGTETPPRSASDDVPEAQPSAGQRSTVFGTPSPEWAGISDTPVSDAPSEGVEVGVDAAALDGAVADAGASFAKEGEDVSGSDDPFAVLAALGSEPSPSVSSQPDTPAPSSDPPLDRPMGEPQRFEGAARFYSSPDLFSRATPLPLGMKQQPRVQTPVATPEMPRESDPAAAEEAPSVTPMRAREDGPVSQALEWDTAFATEAPETEMGGEAAEIAEAGEIGTRPSESSSQPLPEAQQPHADADDGRANNEDGAPDAAPDIATIAIPDPAVAIADDLDIPTPPIEEAPPAPAFDDIDGEFVAAFADFQQADFKKADFRGNDPIATLDAASPGQDEELAAKIEELFAAEEFDLSEHASAAAARSAMQEGVTVASPAFAEHATPPETPPETYGMRDEYYGSAAAPAYADVAEEPIAYPFSQPLAVRDRRGPLVAAVIGCVVIAGAVGVYAYSHHAAKDSGPVLLKADTQPVKVKPKHPGGTKVPNQDNQVYKRVADGDVAAPVEQQKLVTTAEKPVDLNAQAKSGAAGSASASSLPGVEMSKIPQASSDEIAALAKSDAGQLQKNQDRLPASSATGADTSRVDDVIAVEPRKVRTMIVKPDGTMVPTPMPTSTSQAASKSVASAALEDPAAQVPADATSAGGGIVVTPEHVNVTPSRPAGQPAAVEEPARDEKVASVAPAPTTAAASGWAMQIASQPSATAAQASYQHLAHRYGDILSGHGVDIVKAEIAGKGTYYRVRVPTSSREEAIALCTKYKTAGGSCFVAR